MNTIGDRIDAIIKEKGITKTKFAETLCVSQAYISKITIKGSIPSERLIEDICEKFEVSKEWLLTGEGNMFIQKTRSEAIADFMVDLLKEEESSYKRRFIEMLASLSVEEWALIESIALKLAKKED